MDLKNWQFEFQQRGEHPILMADMWSQAMYDYFPKEIDLPITGMDYLFTSENKGYHREGAREAMLVQLKSRLADRTYLQYIFDETIKNVDEFSIYMERGPGDLEWDVFIKYVLKLIPWYFIPWYLTEFNYLSDRVTQKLQAYKTEIEPLTDLNNAAMLLMFPDREMEFQKEQRAFYDLVELTRRGIDIFDTADSAQADSYIERFGWMSTFIVVPGETLTRDDLRKKIETAIAERSDETYVQQQKRKREDAHILDALKSKLAKDTELIQNAEDARYLSWLLTYSVEKSMRAFARGIPWYKQIAQTIGIEYADWASLTVNEITLSLAQGHSVVSEEELAKRRRGYVFLTTEGNGKLYSGDEALSMIKSLEQIETAKHSSEVITELQGKSACTGKAVGTVKVVSTAKNAGIVGNGDILVCGMTTPDYVPAMKKSAAIVTDEGGLLCHAAIISRELGKPCIIATKIATRVLKTGDRVEVDAGKGIVRIIERG